LYAFFWVIPWRPNFICLYAYKIQTPGNYPEENMQHSEHGESLKSRKERFYFTMTVNKNAGIFCPEDGGY